MAITTANKVADYLIRFSHEHGNLVSNLALQKLVYYAQAWHLALKDNPLFDDKIEAWVHGPVVPSVYHRFKKHRWNPIPDQPDDPGLGKSVKDHLDEVMEVYSGFSASQLELMTHKELPWKEARGDIAMDDPSTAEISHASMKAFYRARAESER
jgi:uncharacterized phage-associated protein